MRIGLAGCGRIGGMHAEVIRDLAGVKEVLVADSDPTRATDLSARLGLVAAATVDELFEAGVDALVVAAATGSHALLVERAVETGLPVLCEKPLAADVAQTRALVERIAGSDVPVQVGFQRRFDPGYVRARDLLRSGALGWVHHIRSVTADQTPPPEEFIARSGGLFRDCLVHDFDSIRWLTGREIATVYARGSNRGAPFFAEHGDVDSAAVLLTLDDGTLATVSCTRYNGAGYDVRLEVLGEKDSVAAGLDDHTPLSSAEEGVGFPAGPAWPAFPGRFAAAYRNELAAFLAMARDGSANPCTPQDALEAFYVAEAAELSRRESRPVEVSEVRR
jgi:myo-inositol 2-dehydrogenase/D-chiro-inositol 1-dehydrogenase